MDFWSTAGLAVSFIILTAVLLWVMVPRKGSPILKAILITALLWYGAVLYYTPQRILGWPKPGLPEYAIVLNWKVIEPSISAKEAGIYLWMVPKRSNQTEENFLNFALVDPRHAFIYTVQNVPRAYVMPYERGEHKKLSEAAAKAKKKNSLILFRNNKGKKGKSKRWGNARKDDTEWEILDPRDILKKHDEETVEGH